MDSDWILIMQMKQGREDAWEQFVRKYYGDILKYCHYHCPDRTGAEDLTQETFLKFFAALPHYQHRGKAKNYLYTIAANLCRDALSSRAVLPLEQEPGADTMGAVDDRLALLAAIRRLPPELEEAVILHYYQGLKLTEAAAVLKIGLPLVKYRLKRAKELLRKELEHGFE